MPAQLAFRALAPPELRHAAWSQTVGDGILQQLRGAAFACSGGWDALCCWREDVEEAACLAKTVGDNETAEEPSLKLVGQTAAACSHLVDADGVLLHGRLGRMDGGFVLFLQTTQCCFLVLALFDENVSIFS